MTDSQLNDEKFLQQQEKVISEEPNEDADVGVSNTTSEEAQ